MSATISTSLLDTGDNSVPVADSAAWRRSGVSRWVGIKILAVNPAGVCSGAMVAWIFDEGQEGPTEPGDRVQPDVMGEVAVLAVVPGFGE